MQDRFTSYFQKLKDDILSLKNDDIANWLLHHGYYPESHILPACFRINEKEFTLQKKPYFEVEVRASHYNFNPTFCDTLKISYPKTNYRKLNFEIIPPKIYHDIVYHISNNFDYFLNILFNKKKNIIPYSFPLPIRFGKLSKKRSERLVYSFIKMAEDDLLIESHNYKYILHTDVNNFYSSVYTHSIPWVLHGGKKENRKPGDYSKVGHKLDRLFQSARDGQTNGLPIGSVASDIIAETILGYIDNNINLPNNCKGVRFKDDYRFLCNSKEEAESIISNLNNHLLEYNLNINENKTEILELPNGLYRPYQIKSANFSVLENTTLKRFKSIYFQIIEIHNQNSNKGTIEIFLADLVNYDNKVKVTFVGNYQKEIFLSLLWKLIPLKKRSISLILAITEIILDDKSKNFIQKLTEIYANKSNVELDAFTAIWLYYFTKKNHKYLDSSIFNASKINNPVWLAIKNSKPLFKDFDKNTFNIYLNNKTSREFNKIIKDVAIFKDDEDYIDFGVDELLEDISELLD